MVVVNVMLTAKLVLCKWISYACIISPVNDIEVQINTKQERTYSYLKPDGCWIRNCHNANNMLN
jgi:hypothetical protein